MMTLSELNERFPNEDACRAYLASMRWPDGVRCARCDSEKVHKVNRPWTWQCKQCSKHGYKFTPLVGTIFENTNYPLVTWFQVIYLMCQSKKGISALQIQRTIGSGSYRTAWYMCHRIRAAMENEGFSDLMGGEVEVDETYIGGKAKNRHGGGTGGGRGKNQGGRGPAGKVAVIGAIARKGKVVAKVINNTDAATLQGFVKEAVSDRVDLVATDEHAGYTGMPFPHGVVNHSGKEYVRGNVYTASIDSFWSLIKRGIMGSYHQVSREYLPLYLAEFTFRHNARKDPDMFERVIRQA
jgi:transposase-like protein